MYSYIIRSLNIDDEILAKYLLCIIRLEFLVFVLAQFIQNLTVFSIFLFSLYQLKIRMYIVYIENVYRYSLERQNQYSI